MGDRVTKVSLLLQAQQYLAGADEVAVANRAISKSMSEAQLQAKTFKSAASELGPQLLIMGGLAAAGLALAVVKFSEFQQAMSGVQAASNATVAQMNLLSDAALHAGEDLGISATDVAGAEKDLAAAGVSVSDILGGQLQASLTLATAANIDLKDATDSTTKVLNIFGLSASDAGHVADVLAEGATHSLSSVEDLSAGLGVVGVVANQFGISLEETTGTLAAFSDAGVNANKGGAALKLMLRSLAAPTSAQSDLMANLGITTFDASGKFVGITALAGELHDKLGNLTDAQREQTLSVLFGARALAASNILYQDGATGIQHYVDSVSVAGGAEQQASDRLKNLSGDVKKLGDAFDKSLIQSGSGANDVLRGLVQGFTGLVSAVGNVPGPVLAVGAGLVGVVAAVGLLGGGLLTLIPKIAATRQAMSDLNLSFGKVAGGVAAGAGIAIGIAAITNALSHMNDVTQLSVDQLAQFDAQVKKSGNSNLSSAFSSGSTSSILGQRQGISDLGDALTRVTDGELQLENVTQNLGGSFLGVSHPVADAAAKFGELDTQISSLTKTDFTSATSSFKGYVDQLGGGTANAQKLLGVLPNFKAELINQASAANLATDDQSILNDAMGQGADAATLAASGASKTTAKLTDLSAAANDADGNIQGLSDSIKNFGSTQLDVQKSTDSFYAAVDALNGNLASGAASLDQTTEAGRQTDGMVVDLVSSTNDLAAATLNQTGSQDAANAVLADGRARLIAVREALGDDAIAAGAYADQVLATPTQVSTVFEANTAPAKAEIDALVALEQNRRINILVTATNNTGFELGAGNAYGGTIHRAGGGSVFGGGTSKSDSIPAMLSAGEEVIQNPWSSVFRSQLKQMNRGVVPDFGQSQKPQQISVSIAPKGGIDLLQYVDVSINGAIVDSDRKAAATQSAGYRRDY